MENVDYATAVQVLRDSGNTALLVVRRRVVLPASPEPHTLKVQLQRNKKKDGTTLAMILQCMWGRGRVALARGGPAVDAITSVRRYTTS